MKNSFVAVWLPVFLILFGIGLMYSAFPHGEYGGEGTGMLFLGALLCASGAAIWHYGRRKSS